MYNPKHFQCSDTKKLFEFINRYSFATLLTKNSVSHLPLLHEPNHEKFGTLIGHMAKANEQWRDFEKGQDSLCIFHGPHGYISPSWYASQSNVPTWNYAVVHAVGKAKILNPERTEEIIHKTVLHYESQFANPWQFKLPENIKDPFLNAIVGFEIEIHKLEGKFKLSQNRSSEDRTAVVSAIEKHYAKSDLEFVKIMKAEI